MGQKLDVSLSFGDTYISKSFDVEGLDTTDILELIEEMVDFIDFEAEVDAEDSF